MSKRKKPPRKTDRRAIDDAVAGRPFNPELVSDLDGLASRGHTSGFLKRRPAQDYQNHGTGHSEGQRSQFVGEVHEVGDGWALVETKNKFSVGDTLEIIHPSGNRKVPLTHLKSEKGEAIAVVSCSPL